MDDTSIERSLPEHTLAQAFAERVARWAHDRHAPVPSTDAARGAAYAVSMAVSSGHTCVPLARIAGDGDVAALRVRLADSRVVGAAADGFAFPLVVDATGVELPGTVTVGRRPHAIVQRQRRDCCRGIEDACQLRRVFDAGVQRLAKVLRQEA